MSEQIPQATQEMVQRSHITSHVRSYGLPSGYYARPWQAGSTHIGKIDDDLPDIINGGERNGMPFYEPFDIDFTNTMDRLPDLALDIDAFPFLKQGMARITIDGSGSIGSATEHLLDAPYRRYNQDRFGGDYHRQGLLHGPGYGPFISTRNRALADQYGASVEIDEQLELNTLKINIRPADVVTEHKYSHFEFVAIRPKMVRRRTDEVREVVRQEYVKGIFRERLKQVVVQEPVYETVEHFPLVSVDYYDPETEPANGANTRLGSADEDVSMLRLKLGKEALTIVSPTELVDELIMRQRHVGIQAFKELIDEIQQQKPDLLGGEVLARSNDSFSAKPYALDIQPSRDGIDESKDANYWSIIND